MYIDKIITMSSINKMSNINKMYSTMIKTSIITGTCFGGYYGIKEANRNYCSRKDLTTIEKMGEYFCFGYICLGFNFTGGLLGWVYGVTSPISIPTTMYLMIKKNHKHQTEKNTPDTPKHIGLYTSNFPTQIEGTHKIETRVLNTYIPTSKYCEDDNTLINDISPLENEAR